MKPHFADCAICGNEFQFGPHIYNGKSLPRYGGVMCCMGCWEGNWDGWCPDAEKRLLAVLEEKNLPVPQRNDAGWLPRS